MVERQTRKLEVLVPVTGVRVQIPPPTPEFRKRPLAAFLLPRAILELIVCALVGLLSERVLHCGRVYGNPRSHCFRDRR